MGIVRGKRCDDIHHRILVLNWIKRRGNTSEDHKHVDEQEENR